MPIVFISYRREDSTGYAGRLHEELEQRLGANEVFRDVDTLRPGQDFVEAIEQRLQNCDALVALVGRSWLTATDESGARRIDQPDDYVAMEIAVALARSDVLIVPVLVGGAAMPTAHQLPERLKGLSRKQALVLRDETWEQDVDRLAAVLRPQRRRAAPLVPHARRSMPAAMWIAVAAIIATMAIVAIVALRDPATDTPPDGNIAPAATSTPSPSPSPASAPVPALAPGTGYGIVVSGNPEFATGQAILTILNGSLVNRGGANTLWLRVRGSNEGSYPVALSSGVFRLLVGNEVLVPSTFFSKVLEAHSISQELIGFELSPGPPRADLQITMEPDKGTIPLDLRPSGRPATHEQPDTSDALSRASLSTIVRDPRPLIAQNELAVTILRITSRRFVNKHRMSIALRYENTARYPRSTGELTVRIAHGADMVAPVLFPSEGVDGMATLTGEMVFELPPDAKSVRLKAIAGERQNEIALELP